ncbi:MAG: hypothetical protein KAR20_09590 [Candidatus Heimdallarchaeota archaeon]|nr:hypothetical protein [Candidatus Heimdallarchaeota archaeon]
MNKKTINKILIRKHEKFIESIEDPAVKKLVENNSIITGGAIASMLLNEKVNDYDYYFTNRETVIAVANYYVLEFIKANPDCKVKPEISISDNRIKIIVQSSGMATESGDSAYQYFESRPQDEGTEFIENATSVIADADEIDAEKLEEIGDEKKPYRAIFMTSNAITLSDKVQLIIRFFGDAEEIHKNYDFVHCTNYWTSKDQKVILRPEALESLLSKHLSYVGSKYPVCSIIRTRKFIKRGWHINAGQYIKMLFQVSQLDMTNIDTLEDQLTGVDNAYFYEIIDWFKNKMKEDETFKIDGTYLATIIDKIF